MPETPEPQPEAVPAETVETAVVVDEFTEPADATAEPEPAPFVADGVLLASVDLARRALLEVTAPETVGSVVGHVVDGEHVLSLLFASDLAGYPGWRWSVTIARVDDDEPTVLETELMPGEQALLAPEWVPWSERLAEYRAAQQAAAELAAVEGAEEEGDEAFEGDELDDDELSDDEDDLEDDDAHDDDDDEHDDEHLSHDDDVDGVDIDAFDDDEEPDDVTDGEPDDDEVTPTA